MAVAAALGLLPVPSLNSVPKLGGVFASRFGLFRFCVADLSRMRTARTGVGESRRNTFVPKALERSKTAAMTNNRLTRITVDDAQCGGRPCIRGMRIRVTDILELLGSGATVEEILSDYPYLEREDILASIEYAARQTDHSVLLSA